MNTHTHTDTHTHFCRLTMVWYACTCVFRLHIYTICMHMACLFMPRQLCKGMCLHTHSLTHTQKQIQTCARAHTHTHTHTLLPSSAYIRA